MSWEQWGSLGVIVFAFAGIALVWSNDGHYDHLRKRHAEREKWERGQDG